MCYEWDLIERIRSTYKEMFGPLDQATNDAIEYRVFEGADRTPDKVIQVLERLGWPI